MGIKKKKKNLISGCVSSDWNCRWVHFLLSHRDGEPSTTPTVAAIVLDRLSFMSPFSKDLLVKDLSLRVYEGTHLLVVGNTGTGKTSLLRILNLLWEPLNGERTVFTESARNVYKRLKQYV